VLTGHVSHVTVGMYRTVLSLYLNAAAFTVRCEITLCGRLFHTAGEASALSLSGEIENRCVFFTGGELLCYNVTDVLSSNPGTHRWIHLLPALFRL